MISAQALIEIAEESITDMGELASR